MPTLKLTGGFATLVLAGLTFVFLVLSFVDTPFPAPASIKVDISQASGESGFFQTSVLTEGNTLTGNVTVAYAVGLSPSDYSLYILNDGQYTVFLTSYPRQSYPQVYYYSSGTNVNILGPSAEVEFPVNLAINSTGNYYIVVFQNPTQYTFFGTPTPKSGLVQVAPANSQRYTLMAPSTTFEFVAGVLSLALASLGAWQLKTRNKGVAQD